MSSGPAMPWSAREVRDLEGKGDVRRGSAFLCQLAGTEKRPVGILTNLPQVQSKLFLQWPCLTTCGDEIHHNGPLPLFSPLCSTARPVQERTSWRTSQSPGKQFWKLCVAGAIDGSQLPHGDGDFLVDAALHSPGFVFSFSSGGVHSRSELFSHWLSGSLSRALLADVDSSGESSAYLERPVPTDTQSTRRSAFGSACSLALGTSSMQFSSLSSPSMAMPRSTSSSHCRRDRSSSSPLLPLRSVARTPRSTERPLVRLRPKGYTTNGHSGVGVGPLVPGTSTGVVRTTILTDT